MACAIEPDSNGPFLPGTTVTGKLLCLFNTHEAIQGIKCYLKGEERVCFVDQNTSTEYKGFKTFLRSEIEIMQACTIQAGTYKYPFSFELPLGIPSSFDHTNGRVIYEIFGEVSRGAGRLYRNTRIFQVFVTVNLNDMMHEITMTPVTYPLEEVAESCLCCSSAHVFLALSLEKDAFLIGEDIKINLDVNNVADISIDDVVVKLESHTEVIGEHPQRKKNVSVQEIFRRSKGGLEAKSQKVYTLLLKIPEHLNIYSFRKCKLIKQWFAITAVMIIGDCFDEIRLPADIKLCHTSVERPRPIGLPQLSEERMGPSMVHNFRNFVPVAQAPIENRPPYPLDDSRFPSPHRKYVMPPMPTVHLPASYSATPSVPHTTIYSATLSAPHSTSFPRSHPRNSAPLAEVEELLPQDGTKQPTPPPTYDEAINYTNNATRHK